MKLYKCKFFDGGNVVCSWHQTRYAAESSLEGLQQRRGKANGGDGVDVVDVPTDKPGFIHWLNQNVTKE